MNIDDAIRILKDEGYKHTGKREDLLTLFAETDKYLTAKDVLENMKDAYPGLSFDTIYRNLSLFTNLNILEVTELAGEKHFRFQCAAGHHHHHFICLDCGKTEKLATCPMTIVDDSLDGFQVTGHKFEVYGKCKKCVV
ncbi:Fur family transcriptional regulator [Priestia filamentosa]|uniref:Fur family transcriptional regulator n=1 Tax=Priestia filamentosa TaxID=1402861 RepID=UPI002E2387A6|nr:Fur family transcriptional regulator [Priestia filamentosa]